MKGNAEDPNRKTPRAGALTDDLLLPAHRPWQTLHRYLQGERGSGLTAPEQELVKPFAGRWTGPRGLQPGAGAVRAGRGQADRAVVAG